MNALQFLEYTENYQVGRYPDSRDKSFQMTTNDKELQTEITSAYLKKIFQILEFDIHTWYQILHTTSIWYIIGI